MAENNFILDLIASLKKTQSQKQIKEDIKNLGDFKLPLIGTLSKSKTKAQLKQELTSLNGTVNLTGRVNNKGITTSVQQATQQAQKAVDSKPLEVAFSVKKEKLLNDIKLLAQQNSKLFKDTDMSIKYNSLLDSAEMARNSVELSTLRTQLGSLRSELKVTGNAGLTMTDALKHGLSKVLRLFGSSGVIMQFTAQLRNAWTEAKELDKSMTNLSRVNAEITRNDFPDYLDRVIGRTKQLAVSAKDYIDAVTTFSRAGYNLADSEALSDMAVQLEKVGDMSASAASQALLAGLQGYQEIDGYGMDQLAEKAQALNDKIDLIGNTASISQKEVAEGIQAVGSVMSDANTSVDEFIALLGAGNRAVQDSNKVALAIRTSALRIRSCTAELQEMGESTDDVIESTSDLAEKIKALTNINGSGGVRILEDDEETFRSIYDIYNDIAKVYDKMSDKDASALLDLIAGKNRSNQVSAILQNMSEANALLEGSLNAAGTASAEYEIYLNSAEAAAERFGVAMTETYNNIIGGETVKSLTNAATAVLNFANSCGIVEGSLKGILALGVLKGVTALTVAFKNSAVVISNYRDALNAVKSIGSITKDTADYIKALNTLKVSCANLTDAQLKQVLANRNLSNAQLIEILQLGKLEEAQQLERLTQLGLIQAEEADTAATTTNTAAKKANLSITNLLKVAWAKLTAVIKANPMVAAGVAATAVLTGIIVVYNKMHPSLAQATKDLKEQQEAFDAVTSEVTTLSDELKTAKERIEELESKGPLSLVENEELSKLKETTAELETQLAIKKQEQRLEAKKTADAADKAFHGSFRHKYDDNGELITGDATKSNDPIKELDNSIKAYRKLQEEYNVAKENADFFAKETEKNGGRYSLTGIVSWREYEKYAKQMKSIQKQMDAASTQAQNMYIAVNGQKEAYEGLYEAGYDLRQDQLEEYQLVRESSNAYTEFCADISDTAKAFSELSAEQKRSKLETNFVLSGQSEINAKEIVASLDDSELDIAAGLSFNYNDTIESVHEAIRIAQEEASEDDIEIKIVTFEDAWADSFTSENDKVKELGNALLDLAEKGRLTVETFNEADSTEYFKNLGISADEAVSKINKLVDESKQLSSMSDQISSMVDALGTKKKDGFVSADTLSGFDVEVRGLDSWDRFQEVLGSTTSSYEECQEAADALATEWVNSSDFLAQLTDQNKEYYETQLKAMGVENYEEVISYAQALNEAKEVLSQSSLMLGDATLDEIEALIKEGYYSELTGNMMLALYDAKIAEQAATLNTAEDCQNLINLAGDTDMTAESIRLLIKLMNIYSAIESGAYNDNADLRQQAAQEAESIKKALDNIANGKNKEVEVNPKTKLGNKALKEAKTSGKKTADKYLEAFEDELAKLKDLKDRGKITEKEYLDQLRKLYEKYFKDKKKYLDQYNKYENEYLQGIKSLYESVFSTIAKQYDKKINAANKAKDAAIDALEKERDAEKEALQDKIDSIDRQIKYKEKIIDGIQAEIDAIRDANEERQREIDLQKAKYELERAMHQRTRLVYKDGHMQYLTDPEAIRDKQEEVKDAETEIEIASKEKQIKQIEKEISLLEDKKDALNDQMDAIDKYYDKLISDTENYWDQIINGFEEYKSRYEELADMESDAKAMADLRQLCEEMGVTVEEVLGMSDEAFQKFRDRYTSALADIYSGNDQMIAAIAEQAGKTTDQLGSYLADTQEFVSGLNALDLSSAAEGLEATASGMDKVADSASKAGGSMESVSAEMSSVNEAASGITENLSSISESLASITGAEKIDEMAGFFEHLADSIVAVANALGVDADGSVSSLAKALESISAVSLDGDKGTGLINQFSNLKTAVESITSAISGGGSGSGNAGGTGSQTSGSGNNNAASSLISSFDELKQKADETLGSGNSDSEGSGGESDAGTGIIGQFKQVEEGVKDITAAIGGSEGGDGKEQSEGESDNLIGSITNLGDVSEEILGEPDGEGVIGKFGEFKEILGEANEHVTGISDGLKEIDGQDVECTIRVNIETTGGVPQFATGTALDSMNLSSAEYNAKYSGKSHVEGTALASGNWAVQSNEQSALVGEEGFEIIVRDGRFFTVGDNGAEMTNIKKGDIVFNHTQSEQLLKYGHISGRGKAYADGTVGGGKSLTSDGQILYPLQEGDRAYKLQKAFQPFLEKINDNLEYLTGNAMAKHGKQMDEIVKSVTNNSIVTYNNRNMQPVINQNITINCPNVTNSSGAENIKKELSNLSLKALQVQLID